MTGDECEVCGEEATEIRPSGEYPAKAVMHTARRAAGFGGYDLCWVCWRGIAEQYECEMLEECLRGGDWCAFGTGTR